MTFFVWRFWNTCVRQNEKNGSHLQVYMWAVSPNEEGCIYATAGEQLSDLLPVHVEFSRFSDGSKPNSSPLCRCPCWNNDANIRIFFESSSIVSTFFMFSAKLIVSVRLLLFHFVPFRVEVTVFFLYLLYIIGRQYCSMALCEPAATELKSKNGLSLPLRSLLHFCLYNSIWILF